MSEEGSYGLSAFERFFGFIVLITGIITAYYTATSTSELGVYTPFFVFLCVVMLIIGIVLLTAKIEE
jgi:hypothetical protein